ncbi:MAG: HNH endonuclease [Phycisphaerales bacterium]|nr:HNH endonuclease [Phycisphaerales bacterium]
MTDINMTDYQKYIHKSRYARWREDLGRRETYEETVDRYMEFFAKTIGGSEEKDRQDIRNAILNLEVMPSMRVLMTAGPALERDNVAGYNCGYLVVDSIRAFDESMFVLMCGTGVGFSVERQYISKLPEVSEDFYDTDTVITVADSKIGWAKAYRELLSLLFSGQIPRWNVSKVRPAGAKLKTFGGRASGPQPLVDLFNFSVEVIRNAAGRKLTSIECHDLMCKVADIVVVGGVRRSALISLSNLTDERMRVAKSGQWWESNGQRALANNSVCYTEKPDIGIFIKEWSSLYESKSGERGIFSRDAAKRVAERNGRRDANHDFGTNPCLHPDSLVETVHGRVKIKDITEPTQVYTMLSDGSLGIRRATTSWISRADAPTLKITTRNGKVLRATRNHLVFDQRGVWVEAGDLRVGDKVVQLCRARRGAAYSGVKLTTEDNRAYRMEHVMIADAVYGVGCDDDVHHIDGDTYNNCIDNLEVMSHSDHSRHTATFDNPQNHQVRGVQPNHRSGVGFVSTGKSKKTVVPMPNVLRSNMKNQSSNTIVSIEEGEVTDVYDLTVEDTHNFIADFMVVHNCSEIILRSKQFCNLSEVVVRPEDTLDNLKRKVRIATIIGTIQATLTNFRYLSKGWATNTAEERLLGVSLTGIMDHPVMSGQAYDDGFTGEHGGKLTLPMVLKELKEIAIETNKEWAEKLGIPQSTAITCVKPSGTVSQLVDSASGIHPRYAAYYIRTVRTDKKDPIYQFLKESGVPVEDAIRKENSTAIFSFPVKAPEGSITRDDRSALEQLDLWKVYAEHWCEHKPSITVYVREDEWLKVGAWVYENFDICSGVSFLPHSDHSYQQAPYQEIDKEVYDKAVEDMPEVDWDRLALFELEDMTTGHKELACSAGGCDIL